MDSSPEEEATGMCDAMMEPTARRDGVNVETLLRALNAAVAGA